MSEFYRGVTGKKILLPGVSGVVGKGLGYYLAKRGNEVHGVGRFGNKPVRKWLEENGIVLHVTDVTKPGAADALPDDIDLVYNMTVYWGYGAATAAMWRDAVQVNACFAADLVEKYASRATGLAFGSTGGVYLDGEDIDDLKNEDRDPPEGGVGENIYENSKLVMEEMVRHAAVRTGAKGSVLRYYWPDPAYGVRLDMATMPIFSALKGHPLRAGTGWRHVSYISELVRWTINAAGPGAAACPPPVINVGHPEVVTFERACELAEKVTGKKPNVAHDGYLFAEFNYLGDFAKQEKLLGKPNLPIEEIYRRLARGIEEDCKFPEEWMFEEIW